MTIQHGATAARRRFGSCKGPVDVRRRPLVSTAFVRHRLAIAAFVFALTPVGLAQGQQELWPGVTFRQTVQPTPNGPVVMDVLTGPRPGGTTTLEPLLSNDALQERETLTALESRKSDTATYAGVNGDFFNLRSGLPSGGLVQEGQVLATPTADRSMAGVTADGTLDVRRISLGSSWTGSGAAHSMLLNRVPVSAGAVLYTPAWGPSTPTIAGSVAVVLFPFPVATPGIDLQATVQSVVAGAATVAIPPGGAVLVARGESVAQLEAEAPLGGGVKVRLDLSPSWPGLISAVGGGPLIVRDGAPIFRANEAFVTSQIAPRDPRTAVGQLRDGRIVLVTVDGRQDGWSVGVTNFELAQALVRLGAVTAMAFDSGGSTTMAFDGALLNRPSDGAERPVSTALAFAYTGVFVREPLPAVSPNGDGFEDTESLVYKLVRPSTVTATLAPPGGPPPVVQPVEQQPGTYPVAFPPSPGAAAPEGAWKLTVAATDELGQQSSMTRSFTVDNTLGFLQTSVPRLFLPPGGRELTISWKQTRQARVVVTVETSDGAIVRTPARRRFAAGSAAVVWNGLDRTGQRVRGGVYRAHVVAKSPLGTTQLMRTFSVRQIAAPPA